jgi:hypothetical protein
VTDNRILLPLIREAVEGITSALLHLDTYAALANERILADAGYRLAGVVTLMTKLEEAGDDSLEIAAGHHPQFVADTFSRARIRVIKADDAIGRLMRDGSNPNPMDVSRARAHLSTTLSVLDQVLHLLEHELIEVYFMPFAQ